VIHVALIGDTSYDVRAAQRAGIGCVALRWRLPRSLWEGWVSFTPLGTGYGGSMDVTEVILRDHEWFRRQFIALFDLQAETDPDISAIKAVWDPLAARLDVHAAAEEEVFYPQLLARGEDDPEDETLDAIGDHNDIRDGVRNATRQQVASEQWWAAVLETRTANDEHMAEEEREGIADFRQHADRELRERLGRELEAYLDRHPTTEGVDTEDKDPEQYVDEIESELHPNDDDSQERRTDGSLGIGSLRGQRA
jgi:hypothetical protein